MTPTLHQALPTLERLHKEWSSRRDREKYQDFREPLDAALQKLSEYYDYTADTDVYNMTMCTPVFQIILFKIFDG